MATPITRLRYPSYRGKKRKSLDSCLSTGRESYLDSAELRSLRFNKQVYNRLATSEKKKESLRTYTQRSRDLVNRLTNKPDDEQAVEWYIGGLPTNLAFQCRLGPQSTIAEVIATTEKYETTRRCARVKKHKSKKASYSSSEEEETSTSESNSSESDRSSSRRSKTSARRKKKETKRRDSSEESSSSEEERKPTSSSKRKSKTDKGSMDALMREMADLKLAHWDEKKKEEQGLHSSEDPARQVCFDPRVMDIPSNKDLWPSDSAWNSFGVSTRSKKPSTKEESKVKNKKEKGKKIKEKPVVESESDSDTPPMIPVKYKDDISNVVRTALEGAKDTVNPSEQTPVKVSSVPTLPSSLSFTPRVFDSKVNYLECYEAGPAELEAYHEELKTLYISELELEKDTPIIFKGADIYNSVLSTEP
ncbi:hypothetical protein R1sor_015703 [Riccia sorocarpa]|uniref:Uncharacterized protein n=1 Tax=Riccia sorocarpa TaxID=122646 RepID=A0ABD3HGX1_9MARC